MPDSSGRIPPVAFGLTDAEWQRIFGKAVDGPSTGLDVSTESGGGGVQDEEPSPHKEVREL